MLACTRADWHCWSCSSLEAGMSLPALACEVRCEVVRNDGDATGPDGWDASRELEKRYLTQHPDDASTTIATGLG